MIISCSKGEIEQNETSFTNYKAVHANGLDSLMLQELVHKINNNDYGDVHSLLISKNNELVLEEYFNGYTKNDLHNLYSVSKSFSSALVGIAYDKGMISSMDEKLLNFFPEYTEISNWDERKMILLSNMYLP